MENSCTVVRPHPRFLEVLFGFKSNISSVFKDVLGLHQLHHIAITLRTTNNELISFSSSPALEYNLFSTSLWRYDKTYNPLWFELESQAYWEDLYQPTHFNALYYSKQVKPNFLTGLSLATRCKQGPIVFSLASHQACAEWMRHKEELYRIGTYCLELLSPLFSECASMGKAR
jgi:hypothetical protein